VIANFPKFEYLKLANQNDIEKILSRYDPYSDFNFASLWSYNTNQKLKVSLLNGNLVIALPNYFTSQPVLSILGSREIDESLTTLLDYAKNNPEFTERLELVPEVVVDSIKDKQFFEISEDPSNHDYILSVDEVATFKGKKYYDKRNLVNRFNKAHPDHLMSDLDLAKKDIQAEINQVFDGWANSSKQSHEESAIEKIAINRLLEASGQLGAKGLGYYVDGELVGFVTYEVSSRGYGFISFEKADRKFPGLYAALNHEAAKKLQGLGCEFINFEQDMGIAGLKHI
jgi:hypothetical protein